MQTDNAIRLAGMKILSEKLGIVDAERFISLISRENFDYTKWREKNLNQNISIRELSRQATEYAKNFRNWIKKNPFGKSRWDFLLQEKFL